jgi:cytochrome c biogenesis protein CcmG/thiol:disulfide interchange protein DsbE
MKKTFLLLVACMAVISAFAQQRSLPNANVKTMEGQSFNIQDIAKSGKITVISFWAIWCSPCRKELDAINENFEEWQKKYDIDVVAVSIDDARTVANVKGVVEKHGWPFRVLLDTQREFMQAMNVNNPPYMLLVDKKGNVVMEHIGYTPGDELELEEKFKELTKS